MEDETKMTKENVEELFDQYSSEAEELISNEDEMERFLQKLEKKMQTIPLAGKSLAYVPMMISMLRMYMKKEYTEIPAASVISIVVALIYFLSPVDLIPDVIPGVGYVDDAVVVAACLSLVRTDIEDYRTWREKHGMVVENLPDYDSVSENAEKVLDFGKAYLSGKNSAQK